jgi:putative sterol carrier protein/putative NADPH-quinone reductase
MKVLAINSSARVGVESKTELMLNHLVQGMREAGATVEVVNLHKKKIKYCVGCFSCWTKTPGKCIHKDDMSLEIYPRLLACDLLVLATPLYHYTVNAKLKAFIERTLPNLLPFLEQKEGVTGHPIRHEIPPVAVISVAGFPEQSVFEPLSSYVRFLYGEKLAAEIYRTSAEAMEESGESRKTDDILEATVQGGRELVEGMAISSPTMARIIQPLMDTEALSSIANIFWQTCIDEGVTPREFKEKGMVLRPDSLETFMTVMKVAFNSEKAGDFHGTMQFSFSGDVEGKCFFSIQDGLFSTVEGVAENPDVHIESPFDVWMDIVTGKADGQKMFMEQKYKAVGDFSILMRMGDLFGK